MCHPIYIRYTLAWFRSQKLKLRPHELAPILSFGNARETERRRRRRKKTRERFPRLRLGSTDHFLENHEFIFTAVFAAAVAFSHFVAASHRRLSCKFCIRRYTKVFLVCTSRVNVVARSSVEPSMRIRHSANLYSRASVRARVTRRSTEFDERGAGNEKRSLIIWRSA